MTTVLRILSVRDMINNWDRSDLSNVHIIIDNKQLHEQESFLVNLLHDFITLGKLLSSASKLLLFIEY